MFGWLKRWLFPSDAIHHHASDDLSPLDTDAVVEELDVYQRGSADGRNESPDTAATSLTSTELRIIGFFQSEAQAASTFFRGKLLGLQKALKLKSLTKYENALTSTVPSLQAAIDSLAAQSKPHLMELKRRENELHDEYLSFRRQNHLKRSAHYPENHFFLISILVGILLIEAMLNGYFFAQANEFGLVGGVSQALITAGINIAVGWLFGRFAFTQLNHCSRGRRYAAWVLVPISFVAAIVFYNLFVGHFRDELATTLDPGALQYSEVGQNVLGSVLTNPLGLQSFDSWLLVLVGIIFALIAAADGYNFNDPYPGYGRVAKRHDLAREDYTHDKQVFLDRLEDLKEGSAAQVETIKFDIDAQSRLINDIMTMTHKRESEFTGYMKDLAYKCRHVLDLYRASNREARKTPAPAYFTDAYDLTQTVAMPEIEAFDRHDLGLQLANVNGLLQLVSDVKVQIDQTYTRAVEKAEQELKAIES